MTFPWSRAASGVVGLYTIAAQTVLLREFLVLFHGSEIAFGLFFGAWFVWIAVGATLARSSRKAREFAQRNSAPLLALYPAGALLGLVLLPTWRIAAGIPAYEPSPLGVLAIGALASTGPVSLLTGLLFPALCEQCASDSRTGANAGYAVEALGAVLGGGLTTIALALGLDGLVVLGGLGLFPAAMAITGATSLSWKRASVPAIAILVSLAPLVPGVGSSMRETLATQRLRASLDQAVRVRDAHTPYQLLTLARITGQVVLLADGEVSVALPPGPDEEARAALLSTLPARRDRAVVIGQGGLALAATLTRYFGEVLCVLMDGTYAHVFQEAWEASGAPRDLLRKVHVLIRDERAFASEAPQADLFVVAGGEPATLLANRLYTLDFFAETRTHLTPGGVVAAPVRSAENYIGTEILRYGQTIYQTLAALFPAMAVAPGEQAIILASTGPLTLDPVVLARRYETYAPTPRPFPPDGFVSLLPPDRVGLANTLYSGEAPGDLVNRDDRPLAPFLHLLSFLRESDSPWVAVLWAVHESGPWLASVLLLLFFVTLLRARLRLGPQSPSFAAAVVMASVGGASISGFVALLAAYQSQVGAVYGEIGAVTAVFMAGLSLGAFLGHRMIRFVAPRHARIGAAGFAIAVAACAALHPLILSAVDLLDPWARRMLLGVLFATLGTATGFAWPLAGSLAGPRSVAATLQASDHWGAAVVVPFTGSVALALYGVAGTLWSVAGLLGVTAALVLADTWLQGPHGHRFFDSRVGRLLSVSVFPYRLWPAILTFLTLSTLFVWHASQGSPPQPKTRLTREELRRVETFDREEFRESPLPHHRLEGVQEPAGDAVLATSQAAAPDVQGYGGPLNLVLSVGTDGRIRRVGVLSHRETPSYVRGLPAFLHALIGRDAREPLAVTDPQAVDAMTGATVTRDAVLRALDRTREALAAQVLHLPAAASAPSQPWWRPLMEPGVWYVVFSLIAVVAVHRFGGPRTRLAFLLLSLFVGGFYFNLQLSTSWLLSLARGEWPVWQANATLWLLGAGVLGLSILYGPLYCAHLCPFGALQEVVSRASFRLGFLSRPLAAVSVRMRGLKYAVLALVVLVLFTRAPAEALRFDPLATVFSGRLEGAGAVVALLALAGSLVVFRFWCRVFCPVGAFFLLFNRIAAFLGFVPPRRYAACDLDVHGPADLECLQCNRCAREPLSPRPMHGLVRPLVYLSLVLAVAGIVTWSLWSGSAARVEAAPDASRRTLRTVNVETILRLIQEGRLSDKEAQFFISLPP